MAAFQAWNKMYNWDQQCFHMILSERKNSKFRSYEEISIITFFFMQVFLPVLCT